MSHQPDISLVSDSKGANPCFRPLNVLRRIAIFNLRTKEKFSWEDFLLR